MFLTEKQARTKWCPHVRSICDDGGSANSGYEMRDRDPEWSRCIASGCSQWRVSRGLVLVRGDDGQPIGYGPTDKGYCGLAGRPEGSP